MCDGLEQLIGSSIEELVTLMVSKNGSEALGDLLRPDLHP